jgi:hypothetical protein
MDNSIQHFEHELIKEYYSYSFRSVTLNEPLPAIGCFIGTESSLRANPNSLLLILNGS